MLPFATREKFVRMIMTNDQTSRQTGVMREMTRVSVSIADIFIPCRIVDAAARRSRPPASIASAATSG